MTTKTLFSQLAEFKAGFSTRAAPERITIMENATAQLRASGIEGTALRTGQRAPDVTLPNARGEPIRLHGLLKTGPVILVFYRGGWCPYCNLELRAWQDRLAEVRELGAQLVAISPQTPDSSLSTQEKNALAFEVLSDSELSAARGFGVAFDLPPELVDLYSSVGHDLPITNGNASWTLPVPATYAVGKDAVIRFAHVDVDYRNRAEPSDVLDAIRTMKLSSE
jgi:peroxiredoxin